MNYDLNEQNILVFRILDQTKLTYYNLFNIWH